jgi:hypothetical protein
MECLRNVKYHILVICVDTYEFDIGFILMIKCGENVAPATFHVALTGAIVSSMNSGSTQILADCLRVNPQRHFVRS